MHRGTDGCVSTCGGWHPDAQETPQEDLPCDPPPSLPAQDARDQQSGFSDWLLGPVLEALKDSCRKRPTSGFLSVLELWGPCRWAVALICD